MENAMDSSNSTFLADDRDLLGESSLLTVLRGDRTLDPDKVARLFDALCKKQSGYFLIIGREGGVSC